MNQEETFLVCDIDGTIADTHTPLLMFIWDRFKVMFDHEEITKYYVQQSFFERLHKESPFPPKGQEELRQILLDACWNNPSFYRGLYPLRPLWKTVREWKGPIKFLTSRNAFLADETYSWLKRYGFLDGPDRRLQHANKKTEVLVRLADYKSLDLGDALKICYIDDKALSAIDTYEALSRKDNVVPIDIRVPRRPWNTTCLESLTHNVVSIGRLSDEDIALELAENWHKK